ncbi:alpha-amylase family glycosyl hydrolase [Escherichia coli]
MKCPPPALSIASDTPALTGSELSMTFNFHHLKVDYPGGEKWTLAKPDFVALKTLFRHWQQGMHNVAWNALFA